MKRLLLVVVLCAINACSGRESGSQAEMGSFDRVELYMRRSTFTDTYFEQYSLAGGQLLSECGKVTRNRYQTEAQEVSAAISEREAELSKELWELVRVMAHSSARLPKPVKRMTFNSPGWLRLTASSGATKIDLETTVDGIAEPKSLLDRQVKRVVERIRGTADNPALCGFKQFYGVGAR